MTGFFRIGVLSGLLLAASVSASATTLGSDNTLTWAGCGITKKSFMKELAAAFMEKSGIQVSIEGGGAARGLRDTAERKIDLGGSCRMPLPELDPREFHVKVHPVAWDALVVIAHPDNPVDGLTTDQLRRIYTGKLTNWKELGGPDHEIELYVRKGYSSGVGYALRQYLFQNSQQKFVTPKERIKRSSGPIEKAVENNPYAMAVTGVSSARKRKVKILSLDGKVPSFENVKEGHYMLYRPLYLVTSRNPSPEVQAFVEFTYSPQGREILRANRVVPYYDALELSKNLVVFGFGVK